MRGTTPAQSPTTAAIFGKTPLATASQRYFSNLEARGADPKSIRTYRSAVDPFIENCAKSYVEDVIKQDIINFMSWLRKQPLPQRKHSNPQRTYANKFGHVAIGHESLAVTQDYLADVKKGDTKKAVADADLILVRAEADRDIAPYRQKLGGAQIEQLHRQYVNKRLLERMVKESGVRSSI